MASGIHPRGKPVTGETLCPPPDQTSALDTKLAWTLAFTDRATSTIAIPNIMKPTKPNQSIKKKIAKGLASLYDDIVYKPCETTVGNPARDAMQEIDVGDSHANREVSTPTTSSQAGKADGRLIKAGNGQGKDNDSAGDGPPTVLNVQIDKRTPKHDGSDVLILSEWIGTSSFSIDQSIAIQVDVSEISHPFKDDLHFPRVSLS